MTCRNVQKVALALSISLGTGCSGTGTIAPPQAHNAATHLIYISDQASGAIYAVPTNANGLVDPVITLSGSQTGIESPTSIARDARGNIAVAEGAAPRIDIFAPTASGNVRPSRSIVGPGTNISGGMQVGFDAANELFAGDCIAGRFSFFARDASGASPALRSLQNGAIIGTPGCVGAVAPDGHVVFAGDPSYPNFSTLNFFTFAANASGRQTPPSNSFIGLPDIFQANFTATTFDSAGNFYAAILVDNVQVASVGPPGTLGVLQYPPNPTLETVPKLIRIASNPTGIQKIGAIAVDSDGTLYVAANDQITTLTPNVYTWTIYTLSPKATPDAKTGLYLPTSSITLSGNLQHTASGITL